MKERATPERQGFDGLKAMVPERLQVPLNALSVDLEDWYQVLYFEGHISRAEWPAQESRLEGATERLLDLLEEHGTRATFFVLAWNAERMPWLVEGIRRRGHEIASHGYGHHLVHRQTPAAFAEDLARSLRILRAITGEAVRGYRAPSFSITRESAWALSALMEQGVEYDSSILPARRAYGGIVGAPRAPWVLQNGRGRSLVELPPSTRRIPGGAVPFGGGGYFRLFPYVLVRWGLRHLHRAGLPGVIYLHPWELDPGHPVVPVRRGYRFQHYVNLRRTEAKLGRLLRDFRFVTMGDLADAVWRACGDPGARGDPRSGSLRAVAKEER
jgi:polysaccharide deacetylase family protein (PEP-CTERM system associated)